MNETFSLGWEEWVNLSGLGLPAIKAKIDTGAKTSALHAVAIEPFGDDDNPQVRFIMHPDPADPALEVLHPLSLFSKNSSIIAPTKNGAAARARRGGHCALLYSLRSLIITRTAP